MKNFSKDYIAVIGMAGQFPGAKNINQFWNNIKNKVESITFFNDEELLQSGVQPKHLQQNNYVKAKGFLRDAALFDAEFFGFSPNDSEILDPQFRVFLETAWEALEDAAYDPEKSQKKIGIFAGSSTFNNYYINNLFGHYKNAVLSQNFALLTHNAKDFLASLLAYKLNLKGPCITVQTACSTSLVAICMACESLLNARCEIALAGGVSITTPLKSGYLFQEGMTLSPDGHCRSFDSKANGTVAGDGAGILVLKRLEQAVIDHDSIHAIIKGFAVNNDGNNKMGFTAPSIEGQREVIKSALKMARIKPNEISYIETHGTGTKLGDPIEIAALTDVFSSVSTKNSIILGAVKPNIGHLDVAAGIAGVIKTIQALKEKVFPPNINFEKLNPEINFSNTPFYINTSTASWSKRKYARFAGVSAFGIGGTNAHVILQEPPVLPSTKKNNRPTLLIISAKTRSALIRKRRGLIQYMQHNPKVNLENIAFTLQVGRKDMKCRFACICISKKQAIERLNCLNNQEILDLDINLINNNLNKNHYKKIYSLAKAWLSGTPIAWEKIYSKTIPYRIPLPTYPFERREYWISPANHFSNDSQNIEMNNKTNVPVKLLELKIRDIFKHFLGSDQINVLDDFYDLGGDSLLILQIADKIKKELGFVITPAMIEKHSSAKNLAYFIDNQIRKEN